MMTEEPLPWFDITEDIYDVSTGDRKAVRKELEAVRATMKKIFPN